MKLKQKEGILLFKNYGPLSTLVYELTKPVGTQLNGDIDYYSDRLDNIKGKILEAGVGTGRMLVPLLEDGLDVEGLDVSIDMLNRCKSNLDTFKLNAPLHYFDLTTFKIDYLFKAIIVPTATFCLLDTEEKALMTLKNFYNHLEVGGTIIIDLDLPFYPEIGEVTTDTYLINDKQGITMESKVTEIDWLKQQTITHLKYELWQDGELMKTELQQLLLRWYGLTEFKLMLESVGFTDIVFTGDYDYGDYPTSSTQTITVEAKKPGANLS